MVVSQQAGAVLWHSEWQDSGEPPDGAHVHPFPATYYLLERLFAVVVYLLFPNGEIEDRHVMACYVPRPVESSLLLSPCLCPLSMPKARVPHTAIGAMLQFHLHHGEFRCCCVVSRKVKRNVECVCGLVFGS